MKVHPLNPTHRRFSNNINNTLGNFLKIIIFYFIEVLMTVLFHIE
jgi:hypothetical protein